MKVWNVSAYRSTTVHLPSLMNRIRPITLLNDTSAYADVWVGQVKVTCSVTLSPKLQITDPDHASGVMNRI